MFKKFPRLRTLFLAISVIAILRNVRRLRRSSLIPGRYLLLIAHPDDESMFFSPSLLNLKGRIGIFCLSNGDIEGKGKEREEELRRVGTYVRANVIITDSFSDGKDWDPKEVCAKLLLVYMLKPFDVLMTFDGKGVSGHKNHISCYKGARLFLKIHSGTKGALLKSKGLFRKYVFDMGFSRVSSTVSFGMYAVPIKMMLFHKSQMVWFRYLYIFFSNFMSYNDFTIIN
ncbi:N-acetylglucosaminyl-phosphatidylinositol de-N-acetylase [Encephalitozoon hellem]|uniref:N-acetylglucosaminylphosphatidylinositol deacetylase n=1 Tax=Encephalitozoon hellem TaxID=27973 RepID=A0ABY8CJV2_ENCHE|nr:N-acetylglucosaminyl-phosphatidylinositol de-N-acetylase [Encephalitozoon hellem]